MGKLLLQFRYKGTSPDLSKAASLFGLSTSEIDADYGVIATDPEAGLYSILIDEAASQRAQAVLDKRGAAEDEGVFSNAAIAPTIDEK